MSKRLQVLLDDAEYREIRRAARARKLTVAAWVREAIRVARRGKPGSDPDKKLAVLRTVAALPRQDNSWPFR
jgi:hypothetical protein